MLLVCACFCSKFVLLFFVGLGGRADKALWGTHGAPNCKTMEPMGPVGRAHRVLWGTYLWGTHGTHGAAAMGNPWGTLRKEFGFA